jgi:DNA-binding transcriptional regulator YdaS (Cro superfamily)
MEKKTPYQALQAAVTAARSQRNFAKKLGVAQTTVWKWLQSSKKLPAEHVLTVEKLFGISRHELRPDIYPVDLAPTPEQRERFLAVDMDTPVAGI